MILEYNKPFITKTPTLQIDGLKIGIYRFQLRVTDDAGNVSRPDVVSVQVQSETRFRPIVVNPVITRL